MLSAVETGNYRESAVMDLWELKQLQVRFWDALRLPHDPNDLLHRSYNPVVDRWRIEKLRRNGDILGEEAYAKEIRTNLEKNLRERLKTVESTVTYHIDGEHLYSENFPNEPFANVLKRGAEFRLSIGTPEPEREGLLGERGGFGIVNEKFTDPNTKPGTKITSFSPPGIAKETAYEDKIIDEFKLIEDVNGRYVKLTRTRVDLDYPGYVKLALSLDPHFFDTYDNRPLDAWFLSHPIEGALSPMAKEGLANDRFERIWMGKLLQRLVDDYIYQVRAKNVDWRELSYAFNAILDLSDRGEIQSYDGLSDVPREEIHWIAQRLGRQTPREVGGTGCPTNKGIDLGNGYAPSLEDILSQNSVEKFASGSKEVCKCKDKSDNHYHCPSCGKKYADETHKHERTKECSCGFQFNC